MSSIQSVMHENRVFEPRADWVAQANVRRADYDAMCTRAARDFEGFWADLARETIAWHRPFTKVLDESNAPFFKWFEDGQMNVSYNCLDRNLERGWRPCRGHFRSRRRCRHARHLSRAPSARLPPRKRLEIARRPQG